ncbi:hypothetical protein [Natronorubrum sp. DTA7]|uniref:hypothetical protein n=1 Tax=Natronorubrum sp. DTA7 TaxID=3447016 RepID=UPI003F83CA90
MATRSGHYGHDQTGDNSTGEIIAWTFILTTSFCAGALLIASAAYGWGIGFNGITDPTVNVLAGVAMPTWAVAAFAREHRLVPSL